MVTPLQTAVLDFLNLLGPMEPLQVAEELAFLRDKVHRVDIPAFTIDDLTAAINELREAGRLVRVDEGLKWVPAKEAVGQGKLF